jgi:hypothetical protein
LPALFVVLPAGIKALHAEPLAGNKLQPAELTPSMRVANDWFGISIAAIRNTVVVGSPGATVNGKLCHPAAYLFIQPAGGWKNTPANTQLTASDGAANGSFGATTAIGGVSGR